MIKAPYNFVPLSEKVVSPYWNKQISQDIPFKNSQSGTLKLKIKAESPIYVRNGVSRKTGDKDLLRNEFNNVDNKYFIPGSSIRGMIRSVVEVMSFGRMKNKVNPNKYSVRDFQNNKIYPKTEISNKVECGWLYKDGDDYFLDQCGRPGRISHKNLDTLCHGTKISEYYKNKDNVSKDLQKSARSKNDLFSFNKDQHRFLKDYEDVDRVVYRIDHHDGEYGTIVLTGQPGVRREVKHSKALGKHLEFIFWDRKPTKTLVPDEVVKNLFFAYYDHDRNSQKADWAWRKQELEEENKKIPVFYRTNGDGSIKDMGLTMLYKITYEHSILDAINHTQKQSEEYDLAESIFGYVENKLALKGRVQFGHAFISNGNPKPLELRTEVLAGPKASYYPNYIEQNPNENGEVRRYNTFMDSSAKIRGWKRYPIQSGSVQSNPPPEIKGKINEKVASKFIPLPANTEFSFDLHYHNLRKEELGALLSAITFHNTEGLYHSIGSAKPLGYGKISITIDEGISENHKLEMLKSYESFMDYALEHNKPSWHKLEQIMELMTMAKPSSNADQLRYMDLDEFADNKGRKRDDPKYALPKYSNISKENVVVKSLISDKELSSAIKVYDDEKEVLSKVKSIKELGSDLLKSKESELSNALVQLKDQLLIQLDKRKREVLDKEIELKKQIEQEERDQVRKQAQAKAGDEGLQIEHIDASHRNSFNDLSKEVVTYAVTLHLMNEKQLEREIKDGELLQDDDVNKIIKKIKEIYTQLNSKEKAKWFKKPFKNNFAYKKLTFWLGTEKADILFDELMQDN